MGKNIYQEKFRLRVSDYDCHDRLNVSSILDLCQDVAGKHADELKVGFDDFIKENKVWMIIRTQIEFVEYPSLSSTVLVKTWPHQPNRIDMDRDYLITSEDGSKVFVKASQKWVGCSSITRSLIRARDIHFDIDGYYEERLFDNDFSKLDFDDSSFEEVVTKTSYLDLDHNGHINNVKYFNYILNSISELQGKVIKKMQIDYLHELAKNLEVLLKYKIDDKTIYVKGYSNNIESFACKIIIE